MADQNTPPPTITAMKIPIIKKGGYDIWSIRMRQYICHTNHNLWDIIVNGDLEDEATPSGEQSSPPVPKTAKQLDARRNQERIKSILLLAILDEYLLKFHNVPDAKSLSAAIKSRFGGNEESKKMQKNVLKHQAYVSKEDINQKFLRSLPPSWSQIALIMRNKPDIDEVDIDDLYNNLRVYEDELKRSSGAMLTVKVKEVHSKTEEIWTLRKHLFLLISQRLSATTVTEKGILLENVDLEGVKEEDLMVTGATHKQLNLHLRHWMAPKMSRGYELSNMSTHDKNGLGFGIEMDDLSNKSETNSENRNPLTPRPDISFAGLDEYAFRNKIIESKTTEINKTLDDEDDVCADKTVSSVKLNVTQAVGVKLKKCTGDLIKDYDFYDQKSPEPRVKNVVNTGEMDKGYEAKMNYHDQCYKCNGSTSHKCNPEILLQDHAVGDSGYCGCRTRIQVKEVVQDAQEQPSENASPNKGIQVSEDVFDKEGQHQMPEDEQVWQDELEMMVTQELVANAMNDESRQAFKEEKRRIASQKKAAQATSTNQF
ncbi:hypothetical protein Tco_0977974 [Tanacetum coccineum]|uniref:DUF4219 domain-containing protein n=1 Tax=Tanacetum coccineum TaxID=301880 RepID=A0ABQ5EM31_9ASTR